jgi:glutathione peroxidase
VKFPMFAKSEVSGTKRNALYADLYQALQSEPKWNFYKFLIDRSGKPVDSYNSLTKPDSGKMVTAIEKALAQKP